MPMRRSWRWPSMPFGTWGWAQTDFVARVLGSAPPDGSPSGRGGSGGWSSRRIRRRGQGGAGRPCPKPERFQDECGLSRSQAREAHGPGGSRGSGGGGRAYGDDPVVAEALEELEEYQAILGRAWVWGSSWTSI